MTDPTTPPHFRFAEYIAAEDEQQDPTWVREIAAEQADAILAATERWFIVAMLVLSAVMFIGVGGDWIIAGIGCLGAAGLVARS